MVALSIPAPHSIVNSTRATLNPLLCPPQPKVCRHAPTLRLNIHPLAIWRIRCFLLLLLLRRSARAPLSPTAVIAALDARVAAANVNAIKVL